MAATAACIALVEDGSATEAPHLRYRFPRGAVEPLDVYDLSTADLGRYAGLIVTGGVDQEFLYREHSALQAFLDAGRVVVASVQLFRPWLPGGAPFVPKPIRSFHDYAVRVVDPHPVFAGLTGEDLTFRCGVAGFFARGHHPPPAGAEAVVAFRHGGEPVVYVDRVSTPGTILCHAGWDLMGFGVGRLFESDAPELSAHRIVPQLLAWIRAQGAPR